MCLYSWRSSGRRVYQLHICQQCCQVNYHWLYEGTEVQDRESNTIEELSRLDAEVVGISPTKTVKDEGTTSPSPIENSEGTGDQTKDSKDEKEEEIVTLTNVK